MKVDGLRFSLGVSVLAHAAAFSALVVAGLGRPGVRLPAGDSVITLTLIAAPDLLANPAQPEPVAPVPIALPPAPTPPVPVPPVPAAPVAVPVEAPPEIPLEPPKPALFPEVVPLPASVPVAVLVETKPEQPPVPPFSSPVPSENKVRGDGSSSEPGNDSTTSRAEVGTRARPAYRKNPEPIYPLTARRRGQEGSVLLAVRVTAEGKATRVVVKQSSGFPALDDAAVKAVSSWEFEPARVNSIGLGSDIEVPVRFKLSD